MSLKRNKTLQKLRVPLGFLFGIVFLIFARPTWNLMMIGGGVALFGLFIRAWAAGHIRKNLEVTVSGPYALTRNPLYFGSFLMGIGFCVAAGVWWIALVFAALFLGIYFPVMSVEADELTDAFGDDYTDYARQVSLFFPWSSIKKSPDKKFELALYLRYREYQATLGLIFAWGVLIIKRLFLL